MVDRPSDPREMQLVFALAALGMELLLPTLVGGALDYYFGWAPWGVLIGAGLGLTIVLLHAIRRGNLDVWGCRPRESWQSAPSSSGH
jgi:F0F1-type ATP synthase assembly protein I